MNFLVDWSDTKREWCCTHGRCPMEHWTDISVVDTPRTTDIPVVDTPRTSQACSVQGYCSTGCNMDSKNGPRGPYTSSAWTDTADCLDTLHVTPGCGFAVATQPNGKGRQYRY